MYAITMDTDGEICGQIRLAEYPVAPLGKRYCCLSDETEIVRNACGVCDEFSVANEDFANIMRYFDINSHRTAAIIDALRHVLNVVSNQQLSHGPYSFACRIIDFLGCGVKLVETDLCVYTENSCMTRYEFFANPVLRLLRFIVRLFWLTEQPRAISEFIRSVMLRCNVGDVLSGLLSIILCFTDSASRDDLLTFRDNICTIQL